MRSFIILCCTFCIILHFASGILYHIKSYPNSPCAHQNCRTLSQFIAQIDIDVNDLNTTLVFLPGYHNLSASLIVTGIDNFRLINDDSILSAQTASIVCASSGHINISRTTSVCIVGMHFIGCGNTIIEGVSRFILKNSTFQGDTSSETALVTKNVENATIIRSHFLANKNGKYCNASNHSFTKIKAGGAIFVSKSTVEIIESTFEGNEADRGGVIYAENGTMIIINSSNATNNNALNGGSVLYLNTGCSAIVTASNFSSNNGSILSVYDSAFSIDSSSESFNYSQGGVVKRSQEYSINQSIIIINQSLFFNNSGGVIDTSTANITIEESIFTLNKGSEYSGVIFTRNCFVNIINSVFSNNSAKQGGVIVSVAQFVISPVFVTNISNSTFQHNWADQNGGVSAITGAFINFHINFSLFQYNSDSFNGFVAYINSGDHHIETSISNSVFRYHNGTVLYLVGNNYFINNCTFEFNTGGFGVIFMIYGNMTVGQSIFKSNYRTTNIHAWYTDVVLIGNNTFRDSYIPSLGGVMSIRGGSMITTGKLEVSNNTARSSVVIIIDSRVLFSGNIIFKNNNGSFYAYGSNVTFLGSIVFVNQQETNRDVIDTSFGSESTGLQVGGSITGIYCNLNFHGSVTLARNSAASGGAILTIESIVRFNPDSTVSITNNTVRENGGGISLYRSFLTILGNCTLEGNSALMKGGGIFAVSSSITVASSTASPTHFLALNGNTANKGGGVYFEANSQLSILKSTDTDTLTKINLYVITANNIANFGGGFFIANETNTGICNSVISDAQSLGSECFIQKIDTFEDLSKVLFFSNNSAVFGSNVYGGLLDRCTVSTAASLRVNEIQIGAIETKDMKNAISLLREFSNLTDIDTLASDAVRVCFCLNGKPDCSYKHPTINIKKGESFFVPVVAVDHVNHSVQATIISRVASLTGDFSEGQQFQTVKANCTDLRFNVFSSVAFDQIVLHAEGPCGDAQPSQAKINISFLSCDCPIGFEPSRDVQDRRCECTCSSNITDRISNCNTSTGFVMKNLINNFGLITQMQLIHQALSFIPTVPMITAFQFHHSQTEYSSTSTMVLKEPMHSVTIIVPVHYVERAETTSAFLSAVHDVCNVLLIGLH